MLKPMLKRLIKVSATTPTTPPDTDHRTLTDTTKGVRYSANQGEGGRDMR